MIRSYKRLYKSQQKKKPYTPATICIGVSLITVETETIIQDERAVEIPVDDEIVYLNVPENIVHLFINDASYKLIAEELELEGYLKKHWQIMSVWTVIPPEREPF